MTFEERIWFLAANMNRFSSDSLRIKVINKIIQRFNGRNSDPSKNISLQLNDSMTEAEITDAVRDLKVAFTFYDFAEILSQVLSTYFCSNISVQVSYVLS